LLWINEVQGKLITSFSDYEVLYYIIAFGITNHRSN
jgi:hypothetical protein